MCVCMRCLTAPASHAGHCRQQIRLNFLDFILFTHSFEIFLMVLRSNEGIILLFGLKIGTLFSDHGQRSTETRQVPLRQTL